MLIELSCGGVDQSKGLSEAVREAFNPLLNCIVDSSEGDHRNVNSWELCTREVHVLRRLKNTGAVGQYDQAHD